MKIKTMTPRYRETCLWRVTYLKISGTSKDQTLYETIT